MADDVGHERCLSCEEGLPPSDCPLGPRECGHHCNHSWSHDACCWCGRQFGEARLLGAADGD